MRRILLVILLWPTLAFAQSAPTIQWTHDGTNVTTFEVQIDTGQLVSLGLPTPTGQTYTVTLPVLTAGPHTIRIFACYGATCEASVPITVVKLEN